MPSDIYKRDLYLNRDIPYLFNDTIIEYDIHRAGLSITKEYNLLSEDAIKDIENKATNKKDIAVLLGYVQRQNKDYKEALSKGFVKARETFFRENNIEDKDVLSIKKDAIFVLKECKNTEFGHIVFNDKHHYSSFINTGSFEFYYDRNHNSVDVKGISDILLEQHEEYLMSFIKKFFHKVENEDNLSCLRFMRVFIDRYKKKELECGYYRSFNNLSNYVMLDGSDYTDIGIDLLPLVDIHINYQNVIIPLLNTLIY